MAYSLIANSGIHITTFPLEIRIKEKFSLWFHEWYDTTNGEWILDLAHEVTTETNRYFFKKKKQKHTLLYRCASAFFLLLPQNKMEYIVLCKKI